MIRDPKYDHSHETLGLGLSRSLCILRFIDVWLMVPRDTSPYMTLGVTYIEYWWYHWIVSNGPKNISSNYQHIFIYILSWRHFPFCPQFEGYPLQWPFWPRTCGTIVILTLVGLQIHMNEWYQKDTLWNFVGKEHRVHTSANSKYRYQCIRACFCTRQASVCRQCQITDCFVTDSTSISGHFCLRTNDDDNSIVGPDSKKSWKTQTHTPKVSCAKPQAQWTWNKKEASTQPL